MYSWVNVPTLVRDLARHPDGAALATDLLQALALTDDDLRRLDATPYDDAHRAHREALLAKAAIEASALTVLAATGGVARTAGPAAYFGAADLLADATLGGPADLVRFVRADVLAGAWAGAPGSSDVALRVATAPVALDVVSDGITARYCGESDDGFGAGWQQWVTGRDLPAALNGPGSVPSLVGTLPADVGVVVVPHDWAAHVHDACWAVHLTGRERVAAAAQLSALRALVAACGPRPRHALVATVVAAVAADVVADVLPAASVAAMTAPFFSLVP